MIFLAELGDYSNDEQVNTYSQEYQILPPVMTCTLCVMKYIMFG